MSKLKRQAQTPVVVPHTEGFPGANAFYHGRHRLSARQNLAKNSPGLNLCVAAAIPKLRQADLGAIQEKVALVYFSNIRPSRRHAPRGRTVKNVGSKACRGGSKIAPEKLEKTMNSEPDKTGGYPFTPLNRFLMELFRTISPTRASLSTLRRASHLLAYESGSIATAHLVASMAPRHWSSPHEFDPDRYKTRRRRRAPTTKLRAAANSQAPSSQRSKCPARGEAK